VLPQANAYATIGRRAQAPALPPRSAITASRATGITAYLKNGGTLERQSRV
jgi:hypothetical protein